jgi:hypothetical protein
MDSKSPLKPSEAQKAFERFKKAVAVIASVPKAEIKKLQQERKDAQKGDD